MIRLALRLTLSGGREAVVRLVITAAAVGAGVGLLLAAVAAINALNAQSLRQGWLNRTGAMFHSAPPAPGASAEWWYPSIDEYGDQEIDRVDVAALGPHSPVPPGIPQLPGPGQFYASPALSALLRSVPAGQLAERFPGHQIGTIGQPALPAPGSLIIVIGHAPAQLAGVSGAMKVTSIGTGPGDDPQAIVAVLGIVALALLFPVLVFISTATRLAAARREQRFAAMRLAGATPRQVSLIAAVEAAAAAVTGTAAGFGLFFLFRSDVAKIPFTGQPFFPGDVRLSLPAIVIVAAGVPAAAAVVAHVALRRVRISPLGTARRVRGRQPGAWRIVPLLAGIADLAYFTAAGHPASLNGQLLAYLGGGAVTVAGLVLAGPWLTMAGSALLARRTSRPAGLLAARRLADNPRAAFRSISGLILAVFTATVAVGIITSMTQSHAVATGGATGKDILVTDLTGVDRPGPVLRDAPPSVTVSPSLTGRLRAMPGVSAVLVSHVDPAGQPEDSLVDCGQLARLPALGTCAAGASVATVDFHPHGAAAWAQHPVWPAAPVPASRLGSLPAAGIVVGTDGSTAAIETARTTIAAAFPFQASPATLFESAGEHLLSAWQQLADVVIAAGLPIAACSLAVSVVGGLTDRRRPFSLLRLAGTPVGLLRRVVALESAVPLLAVAIVSAGLGLLVAELFLNSQLGLNLRPPGPAYYGFVAGGVLLSLGIIAATFPLLARITGPEAARSE
jgi:hypothetical protein